MLNKILCENNSLPLSKITAKLIDQPEIIELLITFDRDDKIINLLFTTIKKTKTCNYNQILVYRLSTGFGLGPSFGSKCHEQKS